MIVFPFSSLSIKVSLFPRLDLPSPPVVTSRLDPTPLLLKPLRPTAHLDPTNPTLCLVNPGHYDTSTARTIVLHLPTDYRLVSHFTTSLSGRVPSSDSHCPSSLHDPVLFRPISPYTNTSPTSSTLGGVQDTQTLRTPTPFTIPTRVPF